MPTKSILCPTKCPPLTNQKKPCCPPPPSNLCSGNALYLMYLILWYPVYIKPIEVSWVFVDLWCISRMRTGWAHARTGGKPCKSLAYFSPTNRNLRGARGFGDRSLFVDYYKVTNTFWQFQSHLVTLLHLLWPICNKQQHFIKNYKSTLYEF